MNARQRESGRWHFAVGVALASCETSIERTEANGVVAFGAIGSIEWDGEDANADAPLATQSDTSEVIDPTCQTATCCPSGVPVVEGDDGPDLLVGSSAQQCLVGLGDDDELRGGSAGDFLLGADGADMLVGGSANDALSGGRGGDALDGGSGSDELHGGSGADTIQGKSGADWIAGGAGADTIDGGTGNDTIVAGAGLDHVVAGSGNDIVVVADVCELVAGEQYGGGSGSDAFRSPLTSQQLAQVGVTLSSFESVSVVDPAPSDCTDCFCEFGGGAITCCSGNGTCAEEPEGEFGCECDPGFAGDDCSLVCDGPGGCEAQVFRADDGSVLGMMMFGSTLFPASDATDALTNFKEFVASHEALFRVDDMADTTALDGIELGESLPYGKLVVHRYRQNYRGLSVFGPGSELTITDSGGRGVISFMGRVIDQREDYEGDGGNVISEQDAGELAAQAWTATYPGSDPEVTSIELVAATTRRRLAYRARVEVDGDDVGSVVLAAAVGAGGEVFSISTFEDAFEASGDAQIDVLARDWDQVLAPLLPPPPETLFDTLRTLDGEIPISGSTVDDSVCGGGSCVLMGDERLHAYDGAGVTVPSGADVAPFEGLVAVLANATGVFDTEAGATITDPDTAAYELQNTYHKLRAAVHVADELKGCRWGWIRKWGMSTCMPPQLAVFANVVSSSWGGIFRWHDRSWDEYVSPPLNVGATNPVPVGAALRQSWLDLGHFAQTNTLGDVIAPATIMLNGGGWDESVVYHELGHYLDWFTSPGAGAVGDDGVVLYDRTAACPLAPNPALGCCQQDTPDEAFPLVESVAQLWALYFMRRLHTELPRGEVTSLRIGAMQSFLRAHAVGEAFQFWQFPAQRPAPANQAILGCDSSVGYPQFALIQAFWELADGVVCDAAPDPAGCVPFTVTDEQGNAIAPADAAAQALLYALEHQPPSGGWYQLLFDHMGEYLECRHPDAFAAYVDIFGHHGIVVAQPFPRICPAICGDAAVDSTPWPECAVWDLPYNEIACAAEQCDGVDLDATTCTDLGFDGGALSCNNACAFVTDGCTTCGDGVAEGLEECDGNDLLGSDCGAQGLGGGVLACTPECTFDVTGCLGCAPGEVGCVCLDQDVDGLPLQGPLPGDGSLGDGHYCDDDVVFGGNERCVADGPSFVCEQCTEGQGAFCPCDPADDCLGLGETCHFACSASPCTSDDAALPGRGYCFLAGEAPEDGGVPPWFFDAYCEAYADEHVCNFTLAGDQGNLCVPVSEDDGTSCVSP